MAVVLLDVAPDSVFQTGHGFEHAAPDAPPGDAGEKPLDGVEPGRGCGREVKHPSGVVGEPLLDLGVHVGAVIVKDDMDDLARGDSPLDGIEEFDEFLMPVPFHAPPQHGAVQNVKRGEQGGGAVALVIMGHGGAFARLQRQARLGAVQGLDLALLIDGQHHRVAGRRHVMANQTTAPTSTPRWTGG